MPVVPEDKFKETTPTPQPTHKKSAFSNVPNTARDEKQSVPPAPIANNFVLEDSADSQSKQSAQFADFELKEKQVHQKSTFSAAHKDSTSLSGDFEEESKVVDELVPKQHPVNFDAIKEVDESEGFEASKLQEQEIDQNFVNEQVNKIWSKYDVDFSGSLDKIESANFLNEILKA